MSLNFLPLSSFSLSLFFNTLYTLHLSCEASTASSIYCPDHCHLVICGSSDHFDILNFTLKYYQTSATRVKRLPQWTDGLLSLEIYRQRIKYHDKYDKNKSKSSHHLIIIISSSSTSSFVYQWTKRRMFSMIHFTLLLLSIYLKHLTCTDLSPPDCPSNFLYSCLLLVLLALSLPASSHFATQSIFLLLLVLLLFLSFALSANIKTRE